jgi:hypothetical protein
MKKPDLPPLKIPDPQPSMNNHILQAPIVQSHQPFPVHSSTLTLEKTLIKNNQPISTTLNPVYLEESKQNGFPLELSRGRRFINFLKGMKQDLPSMYKIFLIVIIALVAPLIFPVLGGIGGLGIL